jgi:hypothetical protein
MDQFIDTLGSRISAWLWFARTTSLGSDDLVNDLLDEVGATRRPVEGSADEPR